MQPKTHIIQLRDTVRNLNDEPHRIWTTTYNIKRKGTLVIQATPNYLVIQRKHSRWAFILAIICTPTPPSRRLLRQ